MEKWILIFTFHAPNADVLPNTPTYLRGPFTSYTECWHHHARIVPYWLKSESNVVAGCIPAADVSRLRNPVWDRDS